MIASPAALPVLATLTAAQPALSPRSVASVDVPPPGRVGLEFALVSGQPARNDVRFRFELPRDARARIDVFDLAGRRVSETVPLVRVR